MMALSIQALQSRGQEDSIVHIRISHKGNLLLIQKMLRRAQATAKKLQSQRMQQAWRFAEDAGPIRRWEPFR